MFAFLPIGRWTLLGAIALFVALTYARWKKYPTAPGPMIARFTNVWQAYQMNKGNIHKLNIELHQKHGTFVVVHRWAASSSADRPQGKSFVWARNPTASTTRMLPRSSMAMELSIPRLNGMKHGRLRASY